MNNQNEVTWREYKAADGRSYYYNPITKKTQWSVPTEFSNYQQQVALADKNSASVNLQMQDDRRDDRRHPAASSVNTNLFSEQKVVDWKQK